MVRHQQVRLPVRDQLMVQVERRERHAFSQPVSTHVGIIKMRRLAADTTTLDKGKLPDPVSGREVKAVIRRVKGHARKGRRRTRRAGRGCLKTTDVRDGAVPAAAAGAVN